MANPQQSIWSDLPLTTGIATLVCYAGVFNDVIGVEEMASRLGVAGRDEFHAALTDLRLQRRIFVKDGFACLPSLVDQIAAKITKIETTRQLIESRRPGLENLRKSPIVKFVGISGSLAANNPTKDRNNKVDVDVFLITRSQWLWHFAILRGLRNLFPERKPEHELCIGYIMDEANLLIANRNFYTATEIRNLVPVAGLETYRRFLRANQWAEYYYPGICGGAAPVEVSPSPQWVNKGLYVLYTMLRCIKWRSLDPLRELSFKPDVRRSFNFHELRSSYGGYQGLVQKKFNRLAKIWFAELLDGDLIEKLFPDELSAEIRKTDPKVTEVFLEATRGYDYSKYG